MSRRNKVDYFEMFVKISNYAVQYVQGLSEFLDEHYDAQSSMGKVDPGETLLKWQELHKVEDASDAVTHDIVNNLVTEFVTPIGREDILAMAERLDNVVDELDDVLQHMYMYCVTTVTPEVMNMLAIVRKTVSSVQTACQKFTYFKKSKSIQDYVVRIQDCEEEGDMCYINAVHETFAIAKSKGTVADNIEAYGLAGVLASLERCCDACEDVSETIVTVITKNS